MSAVPLSGRLLASLSLTLALAIPAQTDQAPSSQPGADRSALRQEAFHAKKAGRFAQAATLFGKLVQADGGDVDLWLQHAECLELAHQYNDALDVVEAGKRRFPAVLQFQAALVRNLSLKASDQLRSTGKFDTHVALTYQDCIRQAKDYLGKDPANRDVRLIKTHAHYRLAQLDEARAEAEETVRRFPDHAGAYIVLGDIAFDGYRLLRQQATQQGADTSEPAMRKIQSARDLAFQHYRKALALDATRATAHLQLGHLHAWNGSAKHALAAYGEAIGQKPDTSVPHDWISQNLEPKERAAFYDKARSAYLRRGGDKKGAAILVWYMASAQYAGSDWEAAEQNFVQAGLANRDYASAAYWAMWAAIQADHPERAIVYCAEYARRAPRQFADQIRGLNPAATREATIGHLRAFAAKAYGAGRLDASRDINHVLANVLDNGDSWNNCGFLARETGRYLQSLEAYESALSVEPSSAQIMNDLAVILHYHLGTVEQLRQAEAVRRKDHESAGRIAPQSDVDLSEPGAASKLANENLDRATSLYEKAIVTADRALASGRLKGAELDRTRQARQDAKGNLVKLKQQNRKK